VVGFPVMGGHPVKHVTSGLHSAARQMFYGIPYGIQLLYELRVAQVHVLGEGDTCEQTDSTSADGSFDDSREDRPEDSSELTELDTDDGEVF